MTDAVDGEISIGDVAIDLSNKGGKVVVVDRAADSVAEYDERQKDFDLLTYKSHPLLNVTADEPVWECVYIPEEPTTNFSRTYDTPDSRLARVPVEEADADLRPIQDRLAQRLLEALFQVAGRRDMASTPDEVFDIASHAGIDEDLLEEARELAVVDEHFPPEATDTPADSAGTDLTDDTDTTDGGEDEELGDFERGESQ